MPDDLVASYSSKGPTQIDQMPLSPTLWRPATSRVAARARREARFRISRTANQELVLPIGNLLFLTPTGNSNNYFNLSGTTWLLL